MKKLAVVILFLLSTGAFLNFLISDANMLTTTLKGDADLQWIWIAIDSVAVIVCLRNARAVLEAARFQIPVLLFLCWGILSVTWSENPELTVRRTVGLACTTALGLYLGSQFEVKELLRLLGFALLIVVVSSFLTAWFLPAIGVMPGGSEAWRGVYTHKNTMARVIALAFISFSCLLLGSKRLRFLWAAGLLGCVALLALSQSMTAVAVSMITCLVGLWRRLRFSVVQSIAFFSLVILSVLASLFFVAGDADSIFNLMGRNSTLTGRTYLWQLSAEAVMERPLLGSGWDVFWGTVEGDRIRALIGWEAPHAHNAFLDLSLNTGLTGLGLFLFGLADCMRRSFLYDRDPGNPVREWPLLFYSFIFFYMFTETMIVDRHSLFQFMLVALSVALEKALAANRARLSSGVLESCAMCRAQGSSLEAGTV